MLLNTSLLQCVPFVRFALFGDTSKSVFRKEFSATNKYGLRLFFAAHAMHKPFLFVAQSFLMVRALGLFASCLTAKQKSPALSCLRVALVSKRAAGSSIATHASCVAPLRSADILEFVFSSLHFVLLFALGVVCELFVALRFALLNNKVQTYTVPLSPLTRLRALFCWLRFARVVYTFALGASGSVLFASFPLLPCPRQPLIALPSAGLKTARTREKDNRELTTQLSNEKGLLNPTCYLLRAFACLPLFV